MSQVRVRFAPSPSGPTHIGTARAALFNWLFARQAGGSFVLRIEDTNRERSTPEALSQLLEDLRWLGIDWDEGPEAGGRYGPYFQSRRRDVYQAHLQRLRDLGRVYEKDGAQFFRLEGERYRERDAYLGGEVEKVKTKPIVLDDLVRGKVTLREERDFPLVRANGDPTFHFANVVDDIAMNITHVIRGEDHLTNTGKHLALFRAFEVKPPAYAHLPLILKDPKLGKGKMSKRDRGALVEEYRNRHYLPQAVRNFIALLGWSPKDDREILPLDELIARFDLRDVQKGAARFDERKMAHINFEYMKALPMEDYLAAAKPALLEAGLVDETTDEAYLSRVLSLCQPKIDSFENLPGFCAFFFRDDFPVDEKAREKLLKKGDPAARLEEARGALGELPDEAWIQERLEEAFERLAEAKGQKPFAWYPSIRYAVSGSSSGPDFLPMLEVLGRDRVLPRLEAAAAALAAA